MRAVRFLPLLFLFALLAPAQSPHLDYPANTAAGAAISASPATLALIQHAHTIFLVNGGSNTTFANSIPGGANAPYNAIYAALHAWPRFTLVDAPAKADLILQVDASAHFDFDGNTYETAHHGTQVSGTATRFAALQLTLSSAGQQSTLWQTNAAIDTDSNSSKQITRAFNTTITNLVSSLQLLTSTADSLR